jgi:alkanesulfonate monooxygenase SsuD/methylene tetrahydromethanopterin reductase-like flavin-dependent oxidoreductase (luciferase family)
MQFGVALNIPAVQGRSDAEVVREHMSLGDLAEPLGFDSIFVLEHHFTDYLMSPAPFEMLAFYAGRTSRIKLGTAVVVLPWHDPIRVAEQISLLDIMCNGRCLFAFGRGRAELEFQGFRVPMNEARARFGEAAEIVVGALSNEEFGYDGKFYQIPSLSIRPQAISRPHERFYGSAMSQESSNIIAQLGFGILISTQKSWTLLGADVAHFREAALAAGHIPRAPIVLAAISVAKSLAESGQ